MIFGHSKELLNSLINILHVWKQQLLKTIENDRNIIFSRNSTLWEMCSKKCFNCESIFGWMWFYAILLDFLHNGYIIFDFPLYLKIQPQTAMILVIISWHFVRVLIWFSNCKLKAHKKKNNYKMQKCCAREENFCTLQPH